MRKRFLEATPGGLLIALLVGGCGGGSASSDTPSAAEPAAPSAPAAGIQRPDTGGGEVVPTIGFSIGLEGLEVERRSNGATMHIGISNVWTGLDYVE